MQFSQGLTNITKSMDQENVNVSFTDFESVSINTLKELWKDQDFTDVTLVTSDGRRQLKAHRIILSYASSVFNNIFRQHKHQNPLIFLHDIHFGILEKILEFIYTGKCEIHQDNLKVFLSCGASLGIQRLDGYVENKIENTFQIEANKTETHLSTAEIIALDKSDDDNYSEEMEHLRMGSLDMAQNRTPGSGDKTDQLDKCTENLEEMGSVDKIPGSQDKTVSIPNHISGNLEKMKEQVKSMMEKSQKQHKGRPVYVCLVCRKEGRGSAIIYHIKAIHLEETVISCKLCEKTFRTRKGLWGHMIGTHQKEKRFSCNICDYKTNRGTTMRDHTGWHNGKVFKCNQCNSVAKSERSLKSHKEAMHGVPISCTKCEFKSKFFGAMKNHKETMHEGITYKCDQCAFDTRIKGSLGKHKRHVHSEVIRKQCNMCSYSSKYKWSLKWHQQAVHEGLKFKCDLCDKTLNTPTSITNHKKAHHNQQDQEREYACDECEFTTVKKYSLSRHAEQAHGTKEHNCEKCPYKTKVENSLRTHIHRQHLDNFQCEQCSYSSKQKSHLDIHTKSKHEGESFMCNLCNYKASQSSNLKRHQNTKHKLTKGQKAMNQLEFQTAQN